MTGVSTRRHEANGLSFEVDAAWAKGWITRASMGLEMVSRDGFQAPPDDPHFLEA